jgi:DNA repair exonuclease SbcCD ATPase subunit
MIKFTRIYFKNFLSTGGAGTEIKLDSTSSTLLIGKNGGGKSTMIDALCLGLFNKPFRKLPKPKLVNSKNKKQCLVEINFEIGTKKYLVKRGMKPDIFEIYIDDILINQESKTLDYQDYLEQQILQLNYKSFTQIVVLGSKSYTPFMELKTGPRREVIEDLLDLTIFSKMNIILKERVKALTENISKIESSILTLENNKYTKTQYVTKIENQNLQAETSIVHNIESSNNKIKELEDNISVNNSKLDELISNLETDHTSVSTKLNKFIEMRGGILNNKTNHTKIVQFYSGNDSCPTCKQIIDKDFKESLVSESTQKIDTFETGLAQLNDKISEYQTLYNTIKLNAAKIENIRNIINQYTKEKTIYENQLAQYKKELTNLQTRGTIDTAIEKNEIETIVTDILSKQSELEILLEKRNYLNLSGKMLKDDGIKTMIISQYLPVLNKLINHYLGMMDFFISFNFDENFDEIIKARHRDIFEYNNFSEGEKMRINLAILFSFRKIAELKNTCNTNLLIMDEILDGVLDSDGIDVLTSILREFESNNVFMISHKEEMIDKFNRTLKFVVKDDYSLCEEI